MKLIVGFTIILALMLISVGISMYSINVLSTQNGLYSNHTVPNIDSLWGMRRNLVSAQRNLLRSFVEEDMQKAKSYLEQAEKDGKDCLAEYEAYSNGVVDSNILGLLNIAKEKIEQADAIRKQISELVQNGTEENLKSAKDLFDNQYVPVFDAIAAMLIDFTAQEDNRSDKQRIVSQDAEGLAWTLLTTVSIISIILAILVASSIRKSIMQPIKEIKHAYEEISKGNMQAEIRYESKDELGSMAKSIKETNVRLASYIHDISEKLNLLSDGDMRIQIDLDYIGDFEAIRRAMEKTAYSLSHTMRTINTAAEQVSTGAAQVAGGAQALAAGSSEQASSVEELSASIAAIAGQANDNSVNVKTATRYVDQAVANVKDSSMHMGQLNEAMTNIGSASDQITNITKVIEDIAFQTNILALNAAIEAARAGNAGKGFAVVADEVRNLAAKSAEAAKKTAELIQRSVTTVAEGTQIAAQTALILKSAGEKANMVNESITKIERASADQAVAIEQVRQGLTQVAAVVQTNAATAEENSATSEEMSAQAATLREEVNRFRLKTSHEWEGEAMYVQHKDKPMTNRISSQAESSLGKY